jgi:Raf kinase inhibitor-like YbhB/YbcL family protein
MQRANKIKNKIMYKKSQNDSPNSEAGFISIWLLTFILSAVIIAVAYWYSQKIQQPRSPEISNFIEEEETPTKTAKDSIVKPAETEALEEDVADKSNDNISIADLKPVEPEIMAMPKRAPLDTSKKKGQLQVKTSAAPRDNRIEVLYTCYRSGHSLPLQWSNAPQNTKSYAVIFEELVQGKEPVVKWLAYNIPTNMAGLPSAIPQAPAFQNGMKQAQNDHRMNGYTGPCIPSGVVPYRLRLIALDADLSADNSANYDSLIKLINDHIVDIAEIDLIHHFR